MPSSSEPGIAFVTPSYAGDFELCRILVESAARFLPSNVKHYLFVDRADLEMFRLLESDRTLIAAVEDVLPSGFRHVSANAWSFGRNSKPVAGWLVQQIVKLACAAILSEPVLVLCDSDVALIREIDPAVFARNDRVRLYRRIGGIGPAMVEHARWHRNACELLGLEPDPLPMTDYIGNLISWDRKLVLRMLERVEQATADSWFEAIVRMESFSEYILYGVYADKIVRDDRRLGADERRLCLTHWTLDAIDESSLESFVDSMEEADLSVMVTARLDLDVRLRRAIVRAAIERARTNSPVLPAI